jgi:hypothetical protein
MGGGSSKGAEERRLRRGVARREEAPTGQHGAWTPAGGGGDGGQDPRTLGMGRGAGAPWRWTGGGLEELLEQLEEMIGLACCRAELRIPEIIISPTNKQPLPRSSFLYHPTVPT